MKFKKPELRPTDKEINKSEQKESLEILEYKNIMRKRWNISETCIVKELRRRKKSDKEKNKKSFKWKNLRQSSSRNYSILNRFKNKPIKNWSQL